MKAVVYTQYGPPERLQFKDVAQPIPKNDEVLVRVHASSVNSWDWDLLRGTPLLTRLDGGLLKPRHTILGADVAGRIESIGSGVSHFHPGDEVFGDLSGCGWGGFAEYVCARESALALKPDGLTFEEAAAVPQAGVLALQGLRKAGRIRKGQRILINGAGGGVGTFAVQIAKAFGAEVTGVDGTAKLEMLRSLGAVHVIDYTSEDFTRNGKRYDLILDVVADRSIVDYRRALRRNGRYVMVGGSTTTLLQVASLGTMASMIGDKRLGILVHRPSRRDLNYLKSLIEAGKLAPVIDRCYSLREVPDALRYFGMGQVTGKVVIAVAGNTS
jgi:NADPH:quinone reductase-like Zn-dependent oxidoreductase